MLGCTDSAKEGVSQESSKRHTAESSSQDTVSQSGDIEADAADTKAAQIRFATFNTSLYRNEYGELAKELTSGSEHARKIASIIHSVQPDVMLLNEFDYDGGEAAKLFIENYLHRGTESRWPYYYSAAVNTGVDSGLDLDGNGQTGTPNDAWGFGTQPGQYGMLILSRYPIGVELVRTFQRFAWSKMPEALKPMKSEAEGFYSEEIWNQLRLSSKSHWDVPIVIGETSVHFVVAHPTPPVFDGPEDRNGKRNHDEIRLLRDYVCGEFDGSYIIDDSDDAGDLKAGEHFVVAGDLNADPKDGDGLHEAIVSLLKSPSVNQSLVPSSLGAVEAAKVQGGKNDMHQSSASNDTSDFNDESVGNLRCDYVIPSKNLQIVDCGVFWPKPDSEDKQLLEAIEITDHRMVWVDLIMPANSK